ncbi:hypothetical protein EDB84DRAFT_1591706 [Lactarius hengduanensis]|nr:hypothetical protein EDB84DRAFT_1591706 [Lactarius hengduanensis]
MSAQVILVSTRSREHVNIPWNIHYQLHRMSLPVAVVVSFKTLADKDSVAVPVLLPRRSNHTLTQTPTTFFYPVWPLHKLRTSKWTCSGSTVPRNSGTRRFDLSSRVVVSGQGPSMGNAQTTESQGSGSQLPVKVTVLRAHNIPHKKQFGLLRRRFYVTVADHATMRQTRSVQIDGQMVQWDQVLDAFFTQRSSHLTLCLYEKKRFSHNDVVIGTHADIPIESKNDAPFVLSNGDEKVGQSIQPTIFLTITVPANMASESRISSNNPPKTRIEGGDSPADGVTKPSMPDSEGSIRSTAFEPPLPSSDPLPVEPGTPILVRENAAVALRHVDNTMRSVDLANTWRGAVSGIKLVMDSVSQVAELHPLAKMAYNLVSLIPKTLLDQYGRDDNVLTLLEAMHDAFDLAPQENALRSIQPDSKQAKILTLMLHDVCNCSDFIQSYAQDSDFSDVNAGVYF